MPIPSEINMAVPMGMGSMMASIDAQRAAELASSGAAARAGAQEAMGKHADSMRVAAEARAGGYTGPITSRSLNDGPRGAIVREKRMGTRPVDPLANIEKLRAAAETIRAKLQYGPALKLNPRTGGYEIDHKALNTLADDEQAFRALQRQIEEEEAAAGKDLLKSKADERTAAAERARAQAEAALQNAATRLVEVNNRFEAAIKAGNQKEAIAFMRQRNELLKMFGSTPEKRAKLEESVASMASQELETAIRSGTLAASLSREERSLLADQADLIASEIDAIGRTSQIRDRGMAQAASASARQLQQRVSALRAILNADPTDPVALAQMQALAKGSTTPPPQAPEQMSDWAAQEIGAGLQQLEAIRQELASMSGRGPTPLPVLSQLEEKYRSRLSGAFNDLDSFTRLLELGLNQPGGGATAGVPVPAGERPAPAPSAPQPAQVGGGMTADSVIQTALAQGVPEEELPFYFAQDDVMASLPPEVLAQILARL